jgi:hypothetical protein
LISPMMRPLPVDTPAMTKLSRYVICGF